jgi:hypothetical protein
MHVCFTDILEVKRKPKDVLKSQDKIEDTLKRQVKRSRSSSLLPKTYARDTDDAKELFGKPLWRIIERERDLSMCFLCVGSPRRAAPMCCVDRSIDRWLDEWTSAYRLR